MKLFSTWFFAAMRLQLGQRLRFARAARGSCIGCAARDAARHDGLDQRAPRGRADRPTACARSSSASGPMWRAANSDGVLEFVERLQGGHQHGGAFRVRGRRGQRRLEQRVVAGRVHQLVELGHVGDMHLEEPAVAHRVGVGQRRVGAQRLVDLDHFAADRHVQVGRGLDRLDHAGDLALLEASCPRRAGRRRPRRPARPAHAA